MCNQRFPRSFYVDLRSAARTRQHRGGWPRLGLAVLLPLHLPRPDVCEPGHRALRATAHYSLLTTHTLLTHYSLLTTHYSSLTAHYSLLTTHYSLLTTHDSRLTTHDSRLTHSTHYSLLTTHCSLLTAHYLPPVCMRRRRLRILGQRLVRDRSRRGRSLHQPPVGRLHDLLALIRLICGGGEAQGRRQGWGAKRKSPQTPQAVFTAAAPSTHMEWVGRGKGWDRGSSRCARGRGRLP